MTAERYLLNLKSEDIEEEVEEEERGDDELQELEEVEKKGEDDAEKNQEMNGQEENGIIRQKAEKYGIG